MPQPQKGFGTGITAHPQTALGRATLMAPGSTEKSLTSDEPCPLSLLVRQLPGVTPNYADIHWRCLADVLSPPVFRTARLRVSSD